MRVSEEECSVRDEVRTVVSLLQTIRIISDVCFMLPAQTRPKSLEWRLNSSLSFFFLFSFSTQGGCVSCLRACLGVVEVQVLLYVQRNRRLIRDGSPEPPPRLSHSS